MDIVGFCAQHHDWRESRGDDHDRRLDRHDDPAMAGGATPPHTPGEHKRKGQQNQQGSRGPHAAGQRHPLFLHRLSVLSLLRTHASSDAVHGSRQMPQDRGGGPPIRSATQAMTRASKPTVTIVRRGAFSYGARPQPKGRDGAVTTAPKSSSSRAGRPAATSRTGDTHGSRSASMARRRWAPGGAHAWRSPRPEPAWSRSPVSCRSPARADIRRSPMRQRTT